MRCGVSVRKSLGTFSRLRNVNRAVFYDPLSACALGSTGSTTNEERNFSAHTRVCPPPNCGHCVSPHPVYHLFICSVQTFARSLARPYALVCGWSKKKKMFKVKINCLVPRAASFFVLLAVFIFFSAGCASIAHFVVNSHFCYFHYSRCLLFGPHLAIS